MKIPLHWLRDYVPLTLPHAALIERLTLAGLEVTGVRVLGLPIPEGVRVKEEERGPVWDRDKVVVAEIVNIDKHSDADRLKLPTVTWGEGKTKQLVTGAPNIAVGERGQKVVLALSGAVLLDGHSAERKFAELKPTKIRGVPSDAMVCSLLELGVSEEHEGIILLEDDAPVGMPLADFMGDIVLEADVLPNMARALSMIGVAREVAALTGGMLTLPPAGMQATGESINGLVTVRIDDSALCPRYAAALMRGVKHGAAPGWMGRRLLYAGMRPINNLVDVTNYVMLEWGQPLHAFDFDVLIRRADGKMPTIIVRSATAGEVLVTLDGQERKLTPEHLVIADTHGPIALAGVMGGRDTEVTPATTNVLLESASFDFVSIRRTMRHFNLPSEASIRFSKGIHPETVRPALERAADLLRQHAGGTICQGIVERYPAPLPPTVVELSMAQIERVLGTAFPFDEAMRTLKALEFEVTPTGPAAFRAVVPPHRLDVQAGAADVIEDLARIHGYDRLPATMLADALPEQHTNEPLVFEERVRDLLADCGLQEVKTYALTAPEREAPLLGTGIEYVRLQNPISSERSVLRRSVLASVLEAAASNLRHTDAVRLFEIGPVYQPRADAPLPEEPRQLALVVTGRRQSEFWDDADKGRGELDFFDLKGMVEALLADLHGDAVTYQPSSATFLHPGRAATLRIGERVIGDFGQLHPRVAEQVDLAGRAVLAGSFCLETLQAAQPARYRATPVPRFPAALRDIAVVVTEAVANERVVAEIRAAGGTLLRQVRLFDRYRGDSIPAGTKSLAYALGYQADDRTLTDKEVDKAHKKIEDRLKHVLKAQIRGQA